MYYSIIVSTIFITFYQNLLDFDKITKERAIKLEESLGSREIKITYQVYVDKLFFAGADKYELEQPLIFVREDKNFLYDLEVQYYFSQSNDTIRLRVYSWDSKGFGRRKENALNAQQTINAFNKKYDDLIGNLTASLGAPNERDGNSTQKKDGNVEWIERKAKWHSQKCEVELVMICSIQDSLETNGVKLVPTFRIRVKVY